MTFSYRFLAILAAGGFCLFLPNAILADELMKKPNIIVISKVDSVNTEKLKEIIQLFNEIDKKPITISSFTGEGIDCLMQNILKKIN